MKSVIIIVASGLLLFLITWVSIAWVLFKLKTDTFYIVLNTNYYKKGDYLYKSNLESIKILSAGKKDKFKGYYRYKAQIVKINSN